MGVLGGDERYTVPVTDRGSLGDFESSSVSTGLQWD